jgi:hypothetical protein
LEDVPDIYRFSPKLSPADSFPHHLWAALMGYIRWNRYTDLYLKSCLQFFFLEHSDIFTSSSSFVLLQFMNDLGLFFFFSSFFWDTGVSSCLLHFSSHITFNFQCHDRRRRRRQKWSSVIITFVICVGFTSHIQSLSDWHEIFLKE